MSESSHRESSSHPGHPIEGQSLGRSLSRRAFLRHSALGACSLSLASLAGEAGPQDESPQPFPVAIRVDAGNPTGPLRQIWRFFGADEPNYATMKNGRKLLADMGELAPRRVYFRAHNLLCTGDGTPALKWGSSNAYTEDANGKPVYDWTILDEIFDAYLARGVRPYTEIGFMPKALSSRPEPYQHHWKPGDNSNDIYTGWAYPPTDYKKWGDLVCEWVKHCVEKYGKEEVETWYWEVWNEPDISYWRGTFEEFCKLHDFAIDGVRRALPTARVGGPDTTGGAARWMSRFYEHCLRGTNYATGRTGTPIDFVSFHAKGSPRYVDGHVRMGIANQLRNIDSNFAAIASFPELRDKPIIIGESDPDGCAACGSFEYPQYGYRNDILYAAYTAASFARKHDLADRHGVNLEGALSWSFEFEDGPLFAGFRTMATGGINKPVFNVFRMFSKMTGQRLPVESDGEIALADMLQRGVREKPDVAALAGRDGNKVAVCIWHYHDDDVAGPDAEISLLLDGLPAGARRANVRHYRIDHDHSNTYTLWQRMGKPQNPTPEQYAALEKAGELAELGPATTAVVEDGKLMLGFKLPRHAVSLLIAEVEDAA
jgi:xylan 1,4-beta-xylosidase